MKLRKFRLIFALLFLITGGFVFNYLNDGFSIKGITSSLPPFNSNYCTPALAREKKEEIRGILNQTFHYIGKGCQCYAFESEDGNYVLKLLKHKHLRPLTWLQKIPMTEAMRAYCSKKIAQREKRMHMLFSGSLLAYQEAREETGLLHVHLNRIAEFDTEVLLIDKLGLHHTIKIDDHEFLLQKRGIPAREFLTSIFKQKDEEQLHRKIRELKDLVASLSSKGLRDGDSAFLQNIAFLEEEEGALLVDAGKLWKDERVKESSEKSEEIRFRMKSLREWSEKFLPDLVPIVDQEIALCN